MDTSSNFSPRIDPDLVYRGHVIEKEIVGYRWSGQWYATIELVREDIDRLLSFSTGMPGCHIQLIVQQRDGQEQCLGSMYTNHYYISGHSPWANFKRDQS